MTSIEGTWSGKITGTNNATVFVEVKQKLNNLSGIARINDPTYGTAVYSFTGEINDAEIALQMIPDNTFLKNTHTQQIFIDNRPITISIPSSNHGNVTLNAKLIDNETIKGTWRSQIGTGGNVFLTNDEAIHHKSDDNRRSNDKKSIFISYSHEDKKHLKRLHVHLKPLEKNKLVDIWDDTKIKTGQKWKEEIEKALSKSAIAILIITADFLASDFIIDNELPPILKKAELEGTKILPVVLKACRFQREEHLSQFQALCSPDKPLLSLPEFEQEEIWDRLSQVIENELSK